MTIKFLDNELILNGSEWTSKPFRFRDIVKIGGGGSTPTWQDIVLSGVGSLSLANAKANGLNYLKLFGGTELLPETYIDSVTAEGKCIQSNLPDGYTQVDGVTNANSGYIDTGIVADVDDMEYDLVATIKDNGPVSWYILQSRAGSALPIYGISGSATSNTFIGSFSGTNIGIPSTEMTRTNGHTYHVNFVCKNGTGTITVEDLTDGTTATNTGTYTFASAPTNIGLFGNINGAGTIYGGNTSVHSAYIKKSGVKVMDYVSCTNSSSTAGFYDKATNSFKGATEGSMVAGTATVPSPTTPVDIVCNNGVIKYGKPITLDSTRYYAYLDTLGYWTYASDSYCIVVPVTVGKKYKITVPTTNPLNGAQNIIFRYALVDSINANWTNPSLTPQSSILAYDWVRTTPQDLSSVEITATHPYLIIQMGASVFGYILTNNLITVKDQSIYVDGTTETVTDSNGLTATCQNLLSVGDYKDTQEILSGAVTRNIGIKVLDGSESWVKGTTSFYADGLVNNSVNNNSFIPYCTHYNGVAGTSTANEQVNTNNMRIYYSSPNDKRINIFAILNDYATAQDFADWLAQQYANGTPVIVVYPLATATTESVSGQFLSKSPVTQTAGSISNLPIAITESQKTVPTPQQPLQINCNNGVVKLSPNLVDFNETRINDTTWASADKTKGFEVEAAVYAKIVGSSVIGNANCFGVFVPCKLGKSVSINFFDYTVFGNRCYYCEVDIDGKATTAPVQYATIQNVLTQQTFTLTQPDSIGFVLEWYITSAQTRNYTKENYMVVSGTTRPTAYIPYGTTYVDGTTEKVEVTGKNLFDENTMQTINPMATNNGLWWRYQLGTNAVAIKVPVKPNTTYTLSYTGGNRCFIGGFTNDIPLNPSEAIKCDFTIYIGSANATSPKTFTTPNKCNFICCGLSNGATGTEVTNIQLELGSTATTYEPYFNGGTATATDLYAVGTYKDIQSVLDGAVTRNIGIKVLDGTESWTKASGYINIFYVPISGAYYNDASAERIAVTCTHFVGTDATNPNMADNSLKLTAQGAALTNPLIYIKASVSNNDLTTWQNWLAAQYAAGTPVIIIFPKKTATSETVTGQSLTTKKGSNTITITQASINNLSLEASYKGTV